MFGKRAESVSDYLEKGSKVAVEGKLRWSQWERDGKKRSKLEVVVEEIELMARRQRTQDDHQRIADEQERYAEDAVYDDDIPF